VRFRTLFFVALLPDGVALPHVPPAPEEIESLTFADPGAVLAQWESGSSLVPPPLLPILRRMDRDVPLKVSDIAAAVAEVNRVEDANPRIEFVPGLWVLPVKTRTLPPASCTNVWMPGGRRFVVIDPGSTEPGENARLRAVIGKRVAGGDTVEAIVLSHHHRDHVSGAGTLASTLRVPVLAHDETLARIPTLGSGIATRRLQDGDTLDLDGTTLQVVHTPGHAPGHLAFFDRTRRVLIACDLVSGLSTILVGSDGGDMETYLDALRRAAALDPKMVLPSHGPPLPGKVLGATIAHREAREAAILAVLTDRAPSDIATIAAAAYADTPQAPAFLRELQTRAHLDRLVRQGRVGQEGDSYRLIKR
jgi:glyoxylase-like metal-dependent hydrolase (beta-lactamase superfamily II)